MADYENLTKDQLQDILRDRDLPVSGTKDELLARLNEADEDREASEEASAHVQAQEQVAEAQAEAAQEAAEADDDEKSPELLALEHAVRQDVEAREADPTVAALLAVERARAEEALAADEVELDESVAAMLEAADRDSAVHSLDEAREVKEEVGGRADVVQQLLKSDVEASVVGNQRPHELVNPLTSGAEAGLTLDTSNSGQEPGHVIRVQHRPGAPLSDERAAQWTFPVGEPQPEGEEDEDVFVVDDGESSFTAREGLDEEVEDADQSE